MAEQGPSRTYLPRPLRLPSTNSQSTRIAEQDALLIDLTQFPYFSEGDIVISLSPSDTRPMALHSEVLVKYLGYFEERLKGHVYLRRLARSSRIEGLKGPGTMRYELVCKNEYEWEDSESEMGMLELKQIPTQMPSRYRPTTPMRRAYFLLFALMYEDYTGRESTTLRNFPSLEDTLQFHHLYKLWEAYSCTLHSSSRLGTAIDRHISLEQNRSHAAVALVASPWHVLPLACLLRSKRFYDIAFNAGVWYQFQYQYSTSTRRKNVREYLSFQGPLCEETSEAIKYYVYDIAAALESMADTIDGLDVSYLSDTAKTMWKYYVRHHISQNGYFEVDLEFYRKLWHEKVRSSAVIAFYRKNFPDEMEKYRDKGYFVVRREIRDVLVIVKQCVEPLFFHERGEEYGTLWYDPFTEICEGMARQMAYPWEAERNTTIELEGTPVIEKEGSGTRESIDEGEIQELETQIEREGRRRLKYSEGEHWS